MCKSIEKFTQFIVITEWTILTETQRDFSTKALKLWPKLTTHPLCKITQNRQCTSVLVLNSLLNSWRHRILENMKNLVKIKLWVSHKMRFCLRMIQKNMRFPSLKWLTREKSHSWIRILACPSMKCYSLTSRCFDQ